MDRNFEISLIKFMNRLGISQNIEISRSYQMKGLPSVCILVELIYKGHTDLKQYHCYEYKNGKVVYSEGNEVKGPDQSILAYLGNNRDVDRYFETLARYKAKEYFENNFTYA